MQTGINQGGRDASQHVQGHAEAAEEPARGEPMPARAKATGEAYF